MNHRVALALCGLTLLFILGCGGGGGGASGGGTASNVTVSGDVLLMDTLNPTTPASTVQIGTTSTQTDTTSGGFALTVPSGATSATVTYVPTSGSTEVFTYTFPAATADVDLGDLYVAAAKVTVTGRLVDSSTNLPITGGTASFAGRSAVTGSDGTFALTNVALPTSNFSGFLSLVGTGSATNYFNQSFQANSTVVSGVISVGDVPLIPSGTNTPPGLPGDAQISTSPVTPGTSVTVLSGATTLTTGTTDSSGNVEFWLPVGTYTLQGVHAAQHGSATVTITKISTQSAATITLR